MTRSEQQRSLSFGAEAAAYERGRPSYPPEAIDWLLSDEDSLGTSPVQALLAGRKAEVRRVAQALA